MAIVVITKTQITNNFNKYWKVSNSQNFVLKNNKGVGIIIMFKTEIVQHIDNIDKFLGRDICINLYYKNNNKVNIIGIYVSVSLNSNYKQFLSWTNQKIWEKNNKDFFTIILGDFNRLANPKLDKLHHSKTNCKT
ncbi:1325_t:CDS:1 [Acaulospora morrowiae]|uniref:1325_t:CDS:1 n=1 Tax=Acaulospora morrowiae TaxID=94023 RepID=A0A9N9FFV0_9GLOM|nr:1325_t:CDS:1 [Acaulospora morrowiae]